MRSSWSWPSSSTCASSRRPEAPEDAVSAADPSFHDYLAAKRALDDRSLSEAVWRSLARSLRPARPDLPLRLLEVGAGIGAMIERLLERVDLGPTEYFALDANPAHPPEAARRLEAWATRHNSGWSPSGPHGGRLRTPTGELDVRWITASVFDENLPSGSFDAILAHAFLDLVDLDRTLPRLLGVLRPSGVFYASLNFDGLTAFLPELDRAVDAEIVEAYHATMDARRDGDHPSGDSRTGRRLLVELPRHGARILAAGASDWIVFPRDGSYLDGEATFLRAILDMLEDALRAHPTLGGGTLERWMAVRRRQIDDAQLVFIAHQLDVLSLLSPTEAVG